MWKCQGMSRALDRIWETWEVNSGPLSDWRETGTPTQGMISRRRSETDWALSLVVGNASTHPEKVSTKTRRYLTRLTVGIWVKSSCQSVPGREPLAWWVGKGRPRYLELELNVWQILQEAVIDFRKRRSSFFDSMPQVQKKVLFGGPRLQGQFPLFLLHRGKKGWVRSGRCKAGPLRRACWSLWKDLVTGFKTGLWVGPDAVSYRGRERAKGRDPWT